MSGHYLIKYACGHIQSQCRCPGTKQETILETNCPTCVMEKGMASPMTHPTGEMSFSEYQALAQRTEKDLPFFTDRLMHAQLGLSSEAGEFADALKRHTIYGKELDRENLKEELGDLLWYMALAANALGESLGTIAAANIAKLRDRYPEKYTDADALARKDKA